MKLFDCKSVRLWEKPLATSINRLRSRSTLFPFPDEQQAKKVSFEPFDCPQIMNLNGEWKFRCLACPEQVGGGVHRRAFRRLRLGRDHRSRQLDHAGV